MEVTVVTPTIRKDGLRIVEAGLKNQTIPYRWLIGSPFKPDNVSIEHEWVEDDFKGGYWSLNRIYNKLFKQIDDGVIVTLQDWIWIDPKGLEKFALAIEETGGVISGVGHQYCDTDKYGKPIIQVWDDPRFNDKYGSFYECYWEDCEWNWAAFHRDAIYEVGGMDEELDFLGYGGDQYQVCERLSILGARFYLDQENQSRTLKHGRVKDWDKNHVLFNGAYGERKQDLFERGMWPVLNYLK